MKTLNIHNNTYSLTSAFTPLNMGCIADAVAVWLQFGCDEARVIITKGKEVPISLNLKTFGFKNLAKIW